MPLQSRARLLMIATSNDLQKSAGGAKGSQVMRVVLLMQALERRRLLAGAAVVEVGELPRPPLISSADHFDNGIVAGHTLYISGPDPTNSVSRFLYATPIDGSVATPERLPYSSYASADVDFPFDGRLFYFGDNGGSSGMYASDGTAAGTTVVATFARGAIPVGRPFVSGSHLYFFTSGGSFEDGHIYRINDAASAAEEVGSYPYGLRWTTQSDPLNGRVLLLAGADVWSYVAGDATPTFASEVANYNGGSVTNVARIADDQIMYTASVVNRRSDLYIANANGSGAHLYVLPSANPSYPASGALVASLGTRALISYSDAYDNSVNDVYSTAGVDGDRVRFTGYGLSGVHLVRAPAGDNRVVFVQRETSVSGPAPGIYATDGTLSGTQLLYRVNEDLNLQQAFAADGLAYYQLTSSAGIRLLQTDGTAAGTRSIQYTLDKPFGGWTYFAGGSDRLFVQTGSSDVPVMSFWSLDARPELGDIAGVAFQDDSRDLIRQSAESYVAGTAYLDQNDNGMLDPGEVSVPISAASDGQPLGYRFAGLPVGHYIVRVVTSAARDGFATGGGDHWDIDLVASHSVSDADFAMRDTAPVVLGSLFEDVNANGLRDVGEPPILGQQLYADVNNNGQYDAGTDLLTTADAAGNFRFDRVPVGTITLRHPYVAGFMQTTPADPLGRVVVTQLRQVSSVDPIGLRRVGVGSIAGKVWDDRDGNGLVDLTRDTPAASYIVYLDLNDDGKRQADEPEVTTDAMGAYTFASVSAVGVRVRWDRAARSSAAVETSRGSDPIVLVAVNAATNGVNFIIYDPNLAPLTGRIEGRLFVDRNANIAHDAGDVWAAGITTFLDINGDGLPGTGERSVRTDADGYYRFDRLAPGTYPVRFALPAGFSFGIPVLANRTATVGSAAVVLGDLGMKTTDQTAPYILAWSYDVIARSLRVVFSEDVYGSLSSNDAVTWRLTPGALPGVVNPETLLPSGAIQMSYDTASRTATFTFDGLSTFSLSNGIFDVALGAGSVTDLSGNTLSASTFEFGPRDGDVNGDGAVNFDDLLILAKSYGQTGRTFSQGNIDYSSAGDVGFADLLVLARRYGQSAVPSVASASTAENVTKHRSNRLAGVID